MHHRMGATVAEVRYARVVGAPSHRLYKNAFFKIFRGVRTIRRSDHQLLVTPKVVLKLESPYRAGQVERHATVSYHPALAGMVGDWLQLLERDCAALHVRAALQDFPREEERTDG